MPANFSGGCAVAVLKSIALSLKNYQNGDYALGPADVPDWVKFIGVELIRCTTATPTIWPNQSTQFEAVMELSMDGGATWGLAGRVTGVGGIFVNKLGIEAPVTAFGAGIAPGVGRLIRGTASITGGPLRTQVSVVLSD